MTSRKQAFIRSAAKGLRLAQQHLAENPAKYIQEAMETMAGEDDGKPISNHDVAYFAAMLLAWEDAGRPDFFN